jgi:hypothetical protein
MKYIDKIDWSKLDTETIVVTKTDIGTKYNTMFEAHKCNPSTKEIVSLGLFDRVKLIDIAEGKPFITNNPTHLLIKCGNTLQLGEDGVCMPQQDIITNLMVWRAAFQMPVKQVSSVI